MRSSGSSVRCAAAFSPRSSTCSLRASCAAPCSWRSSTSGSVPPQPCSTALELSWWSMAEWRSNWRPRCGRPRPRPRSLPRGPLRARLSRITGPSSVAGASPPDDLGALLRPAPGTLRGFDGAFCVCLVWGALGADEASEPSSPSSWKGFLLATDILEGSLGRVRRRLAGTAPGQPHSLRSVSTHQTRQGKQS